MSDNKIDIGGVAGAAGSVLGMISNIGAGQRQQKRSKELMDIQFKNQKSLNEQGQALGMKTWNETSYPAQVEKMKEAGLNVGMMYGGTGSGGTTATGSGGSASGGGGGAADIPINAGMGIELGMMAAQKANIEADTKLKEATAEKTSGADTELTKLKAANEEIINNIGNKTLDEQIMAIKANADKAQSEARTAIVGANVAEETQKATEEKIKNESIASALDAGLKQAKINLDEATIKNMAEQIAIGKFNANQAAEFKGIDAVAGSQINKLINKIYNIFGVKEETETQDKIK